MSDCFPHVSSFFETKYKFLEKIGEGGMGEVFKAEERSSGRLLAIKFFRQMLFGNLSSQSHFVQEGKLLSSLKLQPDSNLVSVVGCGTEGDNLYIAFEFVDGVTLRDAIDNSLINTLGDVCRTVISMCNGLALLHQKQIVHLDVKPENVMLPKSGGIKIIDLGVALSLNQRKGGSSSDGQILGTPVYMSPEQCKDEKITYSSDLYSLGVVFYELLTGMPPFWGSIPDVIKKHIFSDPPALSTHNVTIPEPFEKIIFNLLEKVPTNRPRSAISLAGSLKKLLRNSSYAQILSAPLSSLIQKNDGKSLKDGEAHDGRSYSAVTVNVKASLAAGGAQGKQSCRESGKVGLSDVGPGNVAPGNVAPGNVAPSSKQSIMIKFALIIICVFTVGSLLFFFVI